MFDTGNTSVGGSRVGGVGRHAIIIVGNGEVSVDGYGLVGGFVGVGVGGNIDTRVAGKTIGLAACGCGVGVSTPMNMFISVSKIIGSNTFAPSWLLF